VTASAQRHRRGSASLSLVIGDNKRPTPQLRLRLLGGFHAERAGVGWPVSDWHRRTAKTLTKLLATTPGHRLHREQVLEVIWPGVDPESALNSFGKALHAARHALEPELLPRESSSYLRLTESIVTLDSEHVWIDLDHFEQLAESALCQSDIGMYEAAIQAYSGDLLPEDRYEDWCAERRAYLAELHLRLLLDLAEELARRGSYGTAAGRLREALQHDPTREDVHRRLMAVYASAGRRDQAVRQFHLCRDMLRRELDLAPGDETERLYEEIVAHRPQPDSDVAAPFVGRESLLYQLGGELRRADAGTGRMILLSGEAGVGKSRLVAEFAADAQARGCCVLWGGSPEHANQLAYGPFAVALESYVVDRSDAEREELAQRFPALVPFVPSLGIGTQPREFGHRAGDDQLYLVPEIVRLVTDLARDRSVLLVLADLPSLHRSSLNLLGYLATLAAQRRWLIVGTYRDEALAATSQLRRMIDAAERQRLCVRLELEPLARADCDRLVRALLAGQRVAKAVLDHVWGRSLGNPLFVEELLREMQERSELVLQSGEWQRSPSPSARVPAGVRSLVGARMAPMKESARRVLALAAAADGREVTLTDLQIGAAALLPPVSDAALFAALDRALELGVLEERDGSYAFRHPLVRAALYENLSKHRRDESHAALARALTEHA
jgi:DNA-binding SARP family transcriptional activator